jgi:hypothetical protein
VSDADLLEGQQRMFSDPLFKGHYSRLVDATEVTEVRRVSRDHEGCGRPRRTRLAQGRSHLKRDGLGVFADACMYEAYANPPAKVAVYHNMQEGLQWLAKSIES